MKTIVKRLLTLAFAAVLSACAVTAGASVRGISTTWDASMRPSYESTNLNAHQRSEVGEFVRAKREARKMTRTALDEAVRSLAEPKASDEHSVFDQLENGDWVKRLERGTLVKVDMLTLGYIAEALDLMPDERAELYRRAGCEFLCNPEGKVDALMVNMIRLREHINRSDEATKHRIEDLLWDLVEKITKPEEQETAPLEEPKQNAPEEPNPPDSVPQNSVAFNNSTSGSSSGFSRFLTNVIFWGWSNEGTTHSIEVSWPSLVSPVLIP